MTPVTLSLEAHLLSYNKQALIRFMGFLPKTGADPSRKDELVEHIQAELLSIDGLRHVWAELTELEQQALVAAVNDPATPGQLDRRAFQAQHGKLPERSAERSGERVYFSDRSAQHPAMFFTADYAIPGDLVEALRKIIPSPSPYRLPALETLPTTVRGRADGGREANVALTQVRTEPHAFHDLVATLRLIEGGKLKVSASTLAPGALAVRALNDALAQPDYASMPSTEEGRSSSAIRPVGLINFALMTDWAHAIEHGKLVLTQAGMDWMRQPSAEGLREAFGRWEASNAFDELYRVDGLRGTETVLKSYATPPVGRRTCVVRALRDCPPNHWMDVENFFTWVRTSGNDFVVELGSDSHFWTGAYGTYNNLPLGRTNTETYWRAVKCQFMLVVLFEYLAGLGMVDIAYVPLSYARFYLGPRSQRWGEMWETQFSRYDGLKFIRLTPLGGYLLGLNKTYSDAPVMTGSPLRVLPNHQVVLATRLPGTQSGHLVLSKFCTKVSDDVYQFAPERALKTIESGEMSAVEIAAYLERESGTALPQTLRVLLQEIDHKSDRVEAVGEALLFRVGDEALALQFEHDRTMQRLGCRRVGDWLVVPRAKTGAFRRRVHELGFGVKEE